MKRSFSIALTLLLILSSIGAAQRPNARSGFWIGFGLGPGYASADCSGCTNESTSGLSGFIRLGGTLSKHFLLGFESNGWAKSENGVDEQLGFGALTGIFYPWSQGAFFLKLGIGGMGYSAKGGGDKLTATSAAGTFGLGYDIRVTSNMSVTPYINSLASSPASFEFNNVPVPSGEDITLNLIQFGVALTWH